MSFTVSINGFGRIGRLVLRAAMANRYDFDIVAINDITNAKTLAHLLKYDSIHGVLKDDIKYDENNIYVNEKRIKVFSERDPRQLPWRELGVDIVIESTGIFRSRDKAAYHIEAGAKKVVISAPSSGEPADFTVVMGVNDNLYDMNKHNVISNASCTTNCLAPMVKVLNDNFGITYGFMTTIHSYTNDQKILDLPHKDLRRSRAAGVNIIPTTTGAAKAIGLVIPELAGKLHGISIRVPTPDASLTDLVCELKKEVTTEDINKAFKDAASEGSLAKYIEYSEEPLVSSDIIDNEYSMVFDSGNTFVRGGNLVKILGWYDNEWAYSCRICDLVSFIGADI